MLIHLEGIGKRFLQEWIFRNINLELQGDKKYAITGRNGSGKSTLLQLIAGISNPTEGRITYKDSGKSEIHSDNFPLFSSYTAPYQELPEELTGREVFDFHFKFRSKSFPFGFDEFFDIIELKDQGNKLVRFYSSGMKQRLKLGLCIFTQAQVYFLDEPTTNLDRMGIEWYKKIVKERISDKPLFISSNIEEEYQLCDSVIKVSDYK